MRKGDGCLGMSGRWTACGAFVSEAVPAVLPVVSAGVDVRSDAGVTAVPGRRDIRRGIFEPDLD